MRLRLHTSVYSHDTDSISGVGTYRRFQDFRKRLDSEPDGTAWYVEADIGTGSARNVIMTPRSPAYSFIDRMWDEPEPERNLFQMLFYQIMKKSYGKEYVSWFKKYGSHRKLYRMKPCKHLVKNWNRSEGTLRLTHAPFKRVWYGGSYYTPWVHLRCDSGLSFQIQSSYLTNSLLGGGLSNDDSVVVAQPSAMLGSDLHMECQAAALAHMLPELENGFTLPVFLAEIADTTRMFGSVLSFLKDAPSILRNLFSKPLKEVSQAQLSVSFGWVPFVSDVKQIYTRLFNIREDIKKFLGEADKRRTYHYSIRLSPYELIGTDYDARTFERDITLSAVTYPLMSGLSYWIDHVTFKTYKQVSCSDIIYNATIDYSYSLPDWGMWAPILAGMDRFGVNLSLSDFWEVIPFSFVVDWFYNVQSLCSRFDFTNLPPQLSINDFCDSVKYGAAVRYSFDVDHVHPQIYSQETGNYGSWSVTPVFPRPGYTERGYYRSLRQFGGHKEAFPDLTLPNGMQIILGGALVGART